MTRPPRTAFLSSTGNNNSVNLGDVVRVSGKAEEFQGQTQIGNVTAIVNCGTGSVDPTDVTFPFASPDFLEQYEGMLVRLPQTIYVTEHYPARPLRSKCCSPPADA